MGFWDKVGQAEVQEYGKYLPQGSYDVEISRVFENNGFKGQCLVVTFTILSSNSPDVHEGEEYSNVFTFGGTYGHLSFGKAKAFVMALFGVDHRSDYAKEVVSPKAGKIIERAISASNPLAGFKAHVEGVKKKEFTETQWHPFVREDYKFPNLDAFLSGAASPPPPPPLGKPANLPAGWELPDGRWYNGKAWVGP